MTSISKVALAAAITLAATPAWADEGEAITVTGIREAYRGDFKAREIPQAIADIPAETLRDNGIVRLTDALDLNASVARQNSFGGMWDAFAIRGFAGDENLPSGYLVNGFNSGRGFGGSRDVSGIERIEVLKGPAAALYGRGEPGGTINMITKHADVSRNGGYLQASYGSWNTKRGESDLNLALNGKLGLRLTGFYEKGDSFRDTVKTERYGFTPSIVAKLGDATTLTYDLEWSRGYVPFDRGIVAPNGQFGLIPITRFLGEPSDGPTRTAAAGHQMQLQHKLNEHWSVLLGGTIRDTELSGYSNEAELVASRQKLYADGQSLSRQRRWRSYDGAHRVIRAELAGDFAVAGLRNRVLIGADYDYFRNDQYSIRFRPPALSSNPSDAGGNVINILNPVYGRYSPTPSSLITNRVDTQKATGAYLQDQISLSETVQIRLGARYDDYTLTGFNRATGITQTRTRGRLSPQAGIVWQAQRELSLYAAYGQGFRSNIGATASGQIFDPETSQSYEVGAKFAALGERITGTLAFYQLNKANVLAADPANAGFSLAIGRARSRGVELDINARLPGGVEAMLSYAYTDAEARARVQDPNFSLTINPGDRLINIPAHTLSGQITKQLPIGATRLKLGAGVQHVSSRLGETATQFTLPGYTLARIFANWQINDRLDAFVQVRNLFDTTWYANSWASLWVQPGAPRNVTAGLRVKL